MGSAAPEKILGIIEESLSGMEYEVQKGAESPVGNKISFLSGR